MTQDEGKLIAAMHEIKRGGQVDLQTGIQVAQVSKDAASLASRKLILVYLQLALKHRQNKNQRQRIIAFVGSPVKDSQASLVKVSHFPFHLDCTHVAEARSLCNPERTARQEVEEEQRCARHRLVWIVV